MKPVLHLVLLLLVISFCGCQDTRTTAGENKIIGSADKFIKEYHSGTKNARVVVKVVYFHGNDQEPLPHYAERLTRTLVDVSHFYKEEFNRQGIEIDGIPFEKANGKVVFHLIKGDRKSKDYNTNSGTIIAEEIGRKTSGIIDFSREYVVIVTALSYKKAKKNYVFHSPYEGWSENGSANGWCQVADCELLDSENLKDSTERMTFSERAVQNKECSVAEFNSWYIGGIAHEMGHMFGLRHDYGQPSERTQSSLSLMGEQGSHHFRDYLWKGKKSSSFSAAAIFQLISHPVFTQSNRAKDKNALMSIHGLNFVHNASGSFLKAKVKAEDLPYGMVALTRPVSLSEYFSESFYNVLSKDSSALIQLPKLKRGVYSLQLLAIFPNGKVWESTGLIQSDELGNLTESVLGEVNIASLYKKLLNSRRTPEIKSKLQVVHAILNPPERIAPKEFDGSKMFLSDAMWESASVGWKEVARNYFTREAEYKFFLENQGKLYCKGLYAHSPSSYVFNLGGKWKKFSAIVGLRDYAASQGAATFKVYGDGKLLYESLVLRVNQKALMDLDVSNINMLQLRAEATEGHNFDSWAVWLDPMLER